MENPPSFPLSQTEVAQLLPQAPSNLLDTTDDTDLTDLHPNAPEHRMAGRAAAPPQGLPDLAPAPQHPSYREDTLQVSAFRSTGLAEGEERVRMVQRRYMLMEHVKVTGKELSRERGDLYRLKDVVPSDPEGVCDIRRKLMEGSATTNFMADIDAQPGDREFKTLNESHARLRPQVPSSLLNTTVTKYKVELKVAEALESTAILEEIVGLRHQQAATLSKPQLRHKQQSALLKSSQVEDSSIKASYLTGVLLHNTRARRQAPSLTYFYTTGVAAAPDLKEPRYVEGFPMAKRHVVTQSEKRSLKPRTEATDEYATFALPGCEGRKAVARGRELVTMNKEGERQKQQIIKISHRLNK